MSTIKKKLIACSILLGVLTITLGPRIVREKKAGRTRYVNTSIRQAIASENYTRAKKLLNSRFLSEEERLGYAVKCQDEGLAKAYLERSPLSVEQKLGYAVTMRHPDLTKFYLDKSSLSPDSKVKYAIMSGDTELVEFYLRKPHVYINVHLTKAVASRNFDLTRLLLENGANPNENCPIASLMPRYSMDVVKQTLAIIKLIDLLVQYGANADGDGKTVPICELMASYESNKSKSYVRILKCLLDNGADINGNGKTVPLIEVLRNNSHWNYWRDGPNQKQNAAYELLSLGAKVAIRDVNGDTPHSVASGSDTFAGEGWTSRRLVRHFAAEQRKTNEEREARENEDRDFGLTDEQKVAAEEVAESVREYEKTISDIKSQVRLSSEEISAQIAGVRTAFKKLAKSKKFTEVRSQLLDQYTKKYPLAQKILVRTIAKATEDREELVLNLAHATLSGGTTIAPTLGKMAIESSLEVLAEEGMLTEDERKILEITSTIIETLDGVFDADTVLKSAKAVSESYQGFVECGIIKDDNLSDRVKVRIKTGDQVLDVLIILEE